jgi:Fic family protein
MPWNWQLPEWPAFHFNPEALAPLERKFLLAAGSASAFLKKIDTEDHHRFLIEILSIEGEESAKIEGEFLDRESLQSSIKRHFGLNAPLRPKHKKEAGMAELLYATYESFDQPLSHEMLWSWHEKLFKGIYVDFKPGQYRDHQEPMQIVSHRMDHTQVFFEAPPSNQVPIEMERYIEWFNTSQNSPSLLARAAIAHLYFENIHPFEDGNGRIGRALVEKSLSQGVNRSILIAFSKVLERRKKEYYKALESCNRTLEATEWVLFFAEVILQAQEEALKLLYFLIEKSKWLVQLSGKLNRRQEKALLRMFEEGPDGFKGGMSAEKYIAITGASRPTATRDLAELVQFGVLYKTGELRHTRYWLALQNKTP